jgi:hypothetical protein
MSASHKQTVTFTGPQAEYLKSEAEIIGISFSDAVRRLIDTYRGGISNREIRFHTDDQMISWIEEFYQQNRDDIDSISEAIRILVTCGIEYQNIERRPSGPGAGIGLTDEQIAGLRLEALQRRKSVNLVVQDIIQQYLDASPSPDLALARATITYLTPPPAGSMRGLR